jgi:hypothetical protein
MCVGGGVYVRVSVNVFEGDGGGVGWGGIYVMRSMVNRSLVSHRRNY